MTDIIPSDRGQQCQITLANTRSYTIRQSKTMEPTLNSVQFLINTLIVVLWGLGLFPEPPSHSLFVRLRCSTKRKHIWRNVKIPLMYSGTVVLNVACTDVVMLTCWGIPLCATMLFFLKVKHCYARNKMEFCLTSWDWKQPDMVVGGGAVSVDS